jgi:hypothetical protein
MDGGEEDAPSWTPDSAAVPAYKMAATQLLMNHPIRDEIEKYIADHPNGPPPPPKADIGAPTRKVGDVHPNWQGNWVRWDGQNWEPHEPMILNQFNECFGFVPLPGEIEPPTLIHKSGLGR